MIKKLYICLIIFICLISPVLAFDRIYPGDVVYLNETIDISGTTGWASELVYYQTGDLEYKLTLPGFARSNATGSQYSFYIDPKIFNDKIGTWYQWYPKNSGKANDIAFVVERGTRIISSDNTTNITYQLGIRNDTMLSPIAVSTKHIANFLVSRGNDLYIPTNGTARVWIFGDKEGIYNIRSSNSFVYINNTSIQNLRVGNYKVLIQRPGSDGEYNVLYNNNKKILSSLYTTQDSFETKEFDVSILTPSLFLNKIIDEINKTNDNYKMYDLIVEDPTIDIISRDELNINTSTVLQIKGYTNIATGNVLCFSIDEKILKGTTDYKEYCVNAQGKNIGDMRWFLVNIPFRYNDLSVGPHFITGKTELGGSQTVSFNVYETWDTTPKNFTTKYINGNEWIPTPTPEIIRVVETQVVVKETIKTVEVQLTPDLQQLYETDKRAQYTTIIEVVVGGIIIVGILYLISVFIRGRRNE